MPKESGSEGIVTRELYTATRYILLVGSVLWLPFVYLATGLSPGDLFQDMRGVIAASMFIAGAVIANATAVGGGIVFNPMLQLVFGVSGYSALVLSVTVQCAGMTSGTYGWFRKGAFRLWDRWHLLAMGIFMVVSTILSTMIFLEFRKLFPSSLLAVMKVASAVISFYVFHMLWREIDRGKELKARPEAPLRPQEAESPTPAEAPAGEGKRFKVDRRIYCWIALGGLLNVHTAVGAGELVFAHLIKYYAAPARAAVAVGAMMQAVSVLTQTGFILVYMKDYLILDLVCIGLLFTMIGGRMAPLVMTRPVIEPYVKHALALTAFAMGLTSTTMLFLSR